MKNFVECNLRQPLLEWRDDCQTSLGRLGKTVVTEIAIALLPVADLAEVITRVFTTVAALFYLLFKNMNSSEFIDDFLAPLFLSVAIVILSPIGMPIGLIKNLFRETMSDKSLYEQGQKQREKLHTRLNKNCTPEPRDEFDIYTYFPGLYLQSKSRNFFWMRTAFTADLFYS